MEWGCNIQTLCLHSSVNLKLFFKKWSQSQWLMEYMVKFSFSPFQLGKMCLFVLLFLFFVFAKHSIDLCSET